MLRSRLFSANQRLQACAVSDPAHVTSGDSGEHVQLIQSALVSLDGADIPDSERSSGAYGRSTTAAVLAYKTRRNIINTSYQTNADSIVGKMTIARMDAEASNLEEQSDAPFTVAFLRPLSSRF
jgi:hypothetical protein